jgi:hypothetical protein
MKSNLIIFKSAIMLTVYPLPLHIFFQLDLDEKL